MKKKIQITLLLSILLPNINFCLAQPAERLYNQAVASFEEGDIEQSIVLFENSIRAKPKFDRAYLGLAISLFETGRWPEAIPNAQKCVEYSKDSTVISSAYGLLGDIYEAQLDHVAAIKNYDLSIKMNRHNSTSKLSIVQIKIDQGEYRVAFNLLNTVERTENYRCEIFDKLLYLFFILNLTDEALLVFDSIPDDCIDNELNIRMAYLSMFAGDYALALDKLKNVNVESLAVEDFDEYLYARGKSEYYEGSLDSAQHYLNRAWNRFPNDLNVVRAYADALYDSEEYLPSLSLYKSAIRIDSSDYFSILYASLCCLWTRDADFSLYLTMANRLDSVNSYVHIVQAMGYMFDSEYRKALQELDIASSMEPEQDVRDDLNELYARVYCHLKDVKQSSEAQSKLGGRSGDFRIAKYFGAISCGVTPLRREFTKPPQGVH